MHITRKELISVLVISLMPILLIQSQSFIKCCGDLFDLFYLPGFVLSTLLHPAPLFSEPKWVYYLGIVIQNIFLWASIRFVLIPVIQAVANVTKTPNKENQQ